MPDFIVIGAMKAGTTALHHRLAAHPGIGMARLKETEFFLPAKARGRGLDWYARQFPPGDLKRGEVSPNYAKRLVFPGTPERIAALLPDVRLIYILRDPVARALSEYRHLRAMGRLAPGPLPPDAFARLVDASLYARQLEAYLAVFPISALHLATLEADPRGMLTALAGFLGVADDWPEARAAHGNRAASVAAMPGWFWSMRDGKAGQALRRHLPEGVKTGLRRAIAQPAPAAAIPPDLAARIRDAVAGDTGRLRGLTGGRFAEWSV
nr:sulfotransferase [Halovulum dunhuangense]